MSDQPKCPKCGAPLYDNGTVYVHRVKWGGHVAEMQECPAGIVSPAYLIPCGADCCNACGKGMPRPSELAAIDFQNGRIRRREGARLIDNPYPRETQGAQDWERGWKVEHYKLLRAEQEQPESRPGLPLNVGPCAEGLTSEGGTACECPTRKALEGIAVMFPARVVGSAAQWRCQWCNDTRHHHDPLQLRHQPSCPVTICRAALALPCPCEGMRATIHTLRRYVHFLAGHNQFFERCESGWCHPSPKADPAAGEFGKAWKTPAEYEAERDSLRAELAKAKEAAIAEYIDQNSIECDCCGHRMIDVTAATEGGISHCTAGDSEGEGTGCAHSWHHTVGEREAELAASQEREREVGEQLEFDRTVLATAITGIKKAFDSRFWLTEGRGSYEWDDDRYRAEFREAYQEISHAIKPLKKIAADWTACPRKAEDVAQARIDLKRRAESAEERERALRAYRDAAEKYILRLRQIAYSGRPDVRDGARREIDVLDLAGAVERAASALATPEGNR